MNALRESLQVWSYAADGYKGRRGSGGWWMVDAWHGAVVSSIGHGLRGPPLRLLLALLALFVLLALLVAIRGFDRQAGAAWLLLPLGWAEA